MSMNFGGPRGPFPGPGGAANSPSAGRFRNMYQQSPPPNMGQQRMPYHKERAVTFMPNDQVKIPKPPKQPDKPLPAYMRYSRKVWEKVKSQHPEMKMWDIGKLIGEQWRNLPEDERQGFFAEYEVEKSEYQEAMKSYHNSSAYRDWLKAKENAQKAIQDQQMTEKMIGQQLPKEEPRFQLQQVEDDDEDAEFAVKHIAAARFQRNHRLIAEIFGEAIVPDAKTIVTKPRLENLKRQVQSLMQHQKKLENEIQDMEEKFEVKKRKIIEHTENFEVQMKKLSEPPPPLPSPKPCDDENKNIEERGAKVNGTHEEQGGENSATQENTILTNGDGDSEQKKREVELENKKEEGEEKMEIDQPSPQEESASSSAIPTPLAAAVGSDEKPIAADVVTTKETTDKEEMVTESNDETSVNKVGEVAMKGGGETTALEATPATNIPPTVTITTEEESIPTKDAAVTTPSSNSTGGATSTSADSAKTVPPVVAMVAIPAVINNNSNEKKETSSSPAAEAFATSVNAAPAAPAVVEAKQPEEQNEEKSQKPDVLSSTDNDQKEKGDGKSSTATPPSAPTTNKVENKKEEEGSVASEKKEAENEKKDGDDTKPTSAEGKMDVDDTPAATEKVVDEVTKKDDGQTTKNEEAKET